MPTKTLISGIDTLTATNAVLSDAYNTPSKMTRFSLPQFSIKEDPETWFSYKDQIFATRRIYSDFEKYVFFIQNLERQDVTLILDIIRNVNQKPSMILHKLYISYQGGTVGAS